MKRVALLVYPLGTDYGVHDGPRRSVRRAYRRALLEKSTPRSVEYMRALAAERLPATPVATTAPPDAEEVVLLYPDAIGLGFAQIERHLPQAATVRVLNGRRREFIL